MLFPDEVVVETRRNGVVLKRSTFAISEVTAKALEAKNKTLTGDSGGEAISQYVKGGSSMLWIKRRQRLDHKIWFFFHELDHCWIEWKNWLFLDMQGWEV